MVRSYRKYNDGDRQQYKQQVKYNSYQKPQRQNDTYQISNIHGSSYALNHPLLDKGASKSVMGSKWLHYYVDYLTEDLKNEVENVENTDCMFRFGEMSSGIYSDEEYTFVNR